MTVLGGMSIFTGLLDSIVFKNVRDTTLSLAHLTTAGIPIAAVGAIG